MADFVMPSLGADMDEGTLAEWLVKPGDTVKRGDVIAVVETAKGAIEVECFEAGTVRELCVPEGDKVPVGTVLARLGTTEAVDLTTPPAPSPVAPAAAPPPSPAAVAAAPPPSPTAVAAAPPPSPAAVAAAPPPSRPSRPATLPATPDLGMRASPAARAAAQAAGLKLEALTGSGPDGAVVLRDVDAAQRAAPSTPVTPAPAVDPAEAMMQVIARAMERSKREIPHYYLATDIDVTAAEAWLSAYNADKPVEERMLLAALLLRATAKAALKYPEMNGFYVDGRHQPSEAVHVGVAVSLRGGGLISPAIHDVANLTLPQTMEALADLANRARAGRVKASEMRDPTITITSMGSNGVPFVLPVIVPPQVAIVGFGRVTRRPWVVKDAVVPRSILTASLAADHRVSNGHRGALFLAAIDRLLQHPEKP